MAVNKVFKEKKKVRTPLWLKRKIVIALAKYTQPSALAEDIQKVYGVRMSVQAIARFDASTVNGAKSAKALKDLFWKTREEFNKNIEELPMASMAFRLEALKEQYDKANEANRVRDAVFALSIAQHEMRQVMDVPESEAEAFRAASTGASTGAGAASTEDESQ